MELPYTPTNWEFTKLNMDHLPRKKKTGMIIQELMQTAFDVFVFYLPGEGSWIISATPGRLLDLICAEEEEGWEFTS